MPTVRIKRGTRAQLDAAAAANGLLVGEQYLITDEGRTAVATAANAYSAMARVGETGSSGMLITVGSTPPATPAVGDLWVDTN